MRSLSINPSTSCRSRSRSRRPKSVESIEAGQGEVLTGRELDDQAVGLAVLGNVSDPAPHRRPGTAHRDRLIAKQNLSLNRMDAEEGGEELPLALALQAAQAEDLTPMEIEADIVKAFAGAEIADSEDDRRFKHLSDRRFGGKTSSIWRPTIAAPDRSSSCPPRARWRRTHRS